MNAPVLSFLSAVSEKLTSGLFKVQGGESITGSALIFLTLMPAAVSAGAIRIPNVGISFGEFQQTGINQIKTKLLKFVKKTNLNL